MLCDYVKIFIKAGNGGDGAVAFRREKYVPLGGPSGGDGGQGASLILLGNKSKNTLNEFKRKRHYRAERGSNGMSKNMNGAFGKDLYISVPLGTVIRDEQGNVLGDIINEGQTIYVAKGGRGGRGNVRFANKKDKAPSFAEKGEPGEEKTLILELKIIADVGLIGLPNAGKSTLISQISAAKSKIGEYPFTTLEPILGDVQLDEANSFIVADLPGLIEGAASGIGLGHRFLRHAERNRLLVHVLDMGSSSNRSPYVSFKLINEELTLYKEDFSKRPMIIAANKSDLPNFNKNLLEFKLQLGDQYEIFPISALTGNGIRPLLWRINEIVKNTMLPDIIPDSIKCRHTLVRAKPLFIIQHLKNGFWKVSGTKIEKLVSMTDLENEDAVLRMQRFFIKMGLEEALVEKGVVPGDMVKIAGYEFEYME